jgi:hypothetical protein
MIEVDQCSNRSRVFVRSVSDGNYIEMVYEFLNPNFNVHTDKIRSKCFDCGPHFDTLLHATFTYAFYFFKESFI